MSSGRMSDDERARYLLESGRSLYLSDAAPSLHDGIRQAIGIHEALIEEARISLAEDGERAAKMADRLESKALRELNHAIKWSEPSVTRRNELRETLRKVGKATR